ncbi:5-formyltetrahydrofolate cyclo-ligase [Actinomadura harenae]|uniref:5-formyltetrahydrofolate cyclo-ligase n=1 Tax=Actinomadura harenae TaxID=2483351 RepID=A0A3M2LXP7_9ACTN|nr:5-formyltetrahydrofolate cyclo-ligase [Actinomadura harenae]RMI42107.1 5-formyltetrahydrofolate cyclo-ligase [Actinomadura harenae]
MDINQAKTVIRDRIWALLESENAVPEPGVHGRIPNFNGAEQAARRLATLPEWRRAQVIKTVPDRAQEPVRALALEAGRLVYMAVPRLAAQLPFYEIAPESLGRPAAEAAAKHNIVSTAPQVGVEDMQPVDLVVCGSVAVSRNGARLGKGAGYSDIELGLLQEAGLLSPSTSIVTTVHRLQVIEEPLPEMTHDFRVDLIVTPDEVIRCPAHPRPSGIVWDELTEDKIASIPVLAARASG